MKIYEYPTKYTVSALPEDIGEYAWDLTVEYRGNDTWAVSRHSQCLGSDGTWDWEPQPSSREDDWLATHRFGLQEALELARKEAPNVWVNDLQPADILAKHGRTEEIS